MKIFKRAVQAGEKGRKKFLKGELNRDKLQSKNKLDIGEEDRMSQKNEKPEDQNRL